MQPATPIQLLYQRVSERRDEALGYTGEAAAAVALALSDVLALALDVDECADGAMYSVPEPGE